MYKQLDCVFCHVNISLLVSETPNFIVLYDPYPLMEGHLIICSKEHYACAGELPINHIRELDTIKKLIQKDLKKKYNKWCCYEHGRAGGCAPSDPGNRSCHHFHLHVLPFLGNINQKLSLTLNYQKLQKYIQIKSFYEGYGEYLYFEDYEEKGVFYFVENKDIPPHYLRTLISTELGKFYRADWSKFLNNPESDLLLEASKRAKISLSKVNQSNLKKRVA